MWSKVCIIIANLVLLISLFLTSLLIIIIVVKALRTII
uniref:Uncharacterized protein n=1 Tax=Rhizophora mucronata TaxID=61149 RepID=A0A2P2QDH3_RHIMU